MDAEEDEDTFRNEIAALLDRHKANLSTDYEMPVVADWVVVVAIDDAADPVHGGHYLAVPKHAHSYRVKGLLTHGLDMVRGADEP